jgi:hypothetical protein
MALQFIHDNKGNKTGVYIPIQEWEKLKNKYADLSNEELMIAHEPTEWQKEILDERLKSYIQNPNNVKDFSETIRKFPNKE